jgi:hypothetical protein
LQKKAEKNGNIIIEPTEEEAILEPTKKVRKFLVLDSKLIERYPLI